MIRVHKKSGFQGGIHPTNGSDKALSSKGTIIEYVPDYVEIAMEQNFGGTCELLVKKGDHVTIGQKIGEPKVFMASPIHASVSGVVTDVKETVIASGRNVVVCVIKAENKDIFKKGLAYQERILETELSGEELVETMKNAGLSGMGGAGFPTHVKYNSGKKMDYVLINAAECEPYLTCDYRLMLENGMEIINGALLFRKAADAKEAIICMEDNKKDAAAHLESLIAGKELPVRVQLLPTIYPQGGERQLVKAVTGKEIPAGGLPADAGVVISNVATTKAMADAVYAEMPLISRVITVTGEVKKPANYRVPLGTSIQELVKLSGGITKKNNKVIAGGPMTGPCIGTNMTEESNFHHLTKTSSGLLVMEDTNYQESACIRCEQCVAVCPAGISPFKIDFAYMEEDYDLCEKLYATECIACGCCSYICPAQRELTQRVKTARDTVKRIQRERAVKK